MECTAYNFYIFVIYLSLLSPVAWKQKLYTLVIFLLAVFIVNNLRFITVGYIGKYSATMFHYVHDYLWNILFGFMVFLIWVWRYKDPQEEVTG
jgi:exosortase/archaeosortase family protein